MWIAVSAAVAAGVPWARIAMLLGSLLLPVPTAALIGVLWWRGRPDLSMRASWFCDAVATEIRAGATVRHAVETAARSVDSLELAAVCSAGAPMSEVAEAARRAFPDLGLELEALLAGSHRLGVAPAVLFDELGSLGIARVEVMHEVATASAPAKAAAVVLLAVPLVALLLVLHRGGLEPYLSQPTQRAAALAGLTLTVAGLTTSFWMLQRAV